MRLKLSSRSSLKWQHKYYEDPATVCSPINYKLQSISPRLASTVAVNVIINAIRKRQVVHRLYLGASSLCDTGCVRLFEFLTSPAGLHCREGLTELFLTRNEIGARGLLAVAAFLRGNTVLRELCLSGNPLTTDPDVIAEFASALNSSRLCTLQILHSSSLGDSFAQVFLPRLSTPYLRDLDLSAINMTRAIVPTLTDYVRSTRCRLERLQCNANSLTLSGAYSIVSAIEENHSLQDGRLDDLHLDDQAVVAAEDRIVGWLLCNRALFAIFKRNSVYTTRVKHESLALLRCSRALFLRSGTGKADSGSPFTCLSRRGGHLRTLHTFSPFFNLPAELQQEIISYLAPSLSNQQRMRIVHFASDITTLSPLNPLSNGVHGQTKQREAVVRTSLGRRPHSQQCQAHEGTWRPPTWWECHCSTDIRPSCRCLHRWKRERRDIWLAQVGCDTYEHAI